MLLGNLFKDVRHYSIRILCFLNYIVLYHTSLATIEDINIDWNGKVLEEAIKICNGLHQSLTSATNEVINAIRINSNTTIVT